MVAVKYIQQGQGLKLKSKYLGLCKVTKEKITTPT